MAHDVICSKILLYSDRHEFLITQNAWKRCCWHCNIWPDWFTSHQETNRTIILPYGIPEETISVNIWIAHTTQNSWHFIVRNSSPLKKWQTLAIIREISYSNLETGRYGQKSGVSQIIQESWQQCSGHTSGQIEQEKNGQSLDSTDWKWTACSSVGEGG